MKFFLEIYKITNSQIKGSFLSIINNIKKRYLYIKINIILGGLLNYLIYNYIY